MKFKNPLSREKFHRRTISGMPELFFELLLYLTCFFPFIQFVWWGSDTQPYAALTSVLIILVYWFRTGTGEKKFLVLALCCIGMGAFVLVDIVMDGFLSAFRSYFSYISLICIPLAVFLILKRRGGLNEPLLKCCMWVWFAVGLIQRYFIPEFGFRFLSRHTTGGTRGAISLAPEPSAYGYMCLFMLLLALQMKKNAQLYAVMLLIQIIVFASSSVTLVYLAFYIIAYMLNELLWHKKFALFKVVVVAGGGLLTLFTIRAVVPPTNRMGALVAYLFEEPQKIIEDESIVMRVEAIRFGFESFVRNHFLPHGMFDFKIMSGMGGLFYECGFVALLILGAIGVLIWKGSRKGYRFMYVFGYMAIMFSSIPFSAPVMCFYLGVCLYQAWEAERKREEEEADAFEKDLPFVWYRGRLYVQKERREGQDESIVDM